MAHMMMMMIKAFSILQICCKKNCSSVYIEDIYCFEVNIKYISLSVLKTSEFSRVRSKSENSDVFNSQDEIYLVFTKKKE